MEGRMFCRRASLQHMICDSQVLNQEEFILVIKNNQRFLCIVSANYNCDLGLTIQVNGNFSISW